VFSKIFLWFVIKESPYIGNRNQRSGLDIIVIIHYSTRDFNHRVTFTEHFIVCCYRLLLLLLLFDQTTRSVKYCLNNNIKYNKNNQYINSFFWIPPSIFICCAQFKKTPQPNVFSLSYIYIYIYNIANVHSVESILCC